MTTHRMDIGTYTRKYGDNEVIFEEGSSDKDMYFIVYGKVEVSQRAGDKKMIVTTLDSGDFFGEMASLTGYNRTMTITAKGNVYLWKMSSDEMLQYMQMSPRFATNMCTKMAHRLGYANLLLRNLAVKTMPVSKDEDAEGETFRYLYRQLMDRTEQLKDRREELRKKDIEIRELRSQLKSERPSLFLRGRERRLASQ